MKKYIYPLIYSLIGCILFGLIGLLWFMKYWASDCDMPGKICDCFCCNLFGLRGYESCANYGFLLGWWIGIIIGIFVYLFIKNKHNNIFSRK